MKKTILAIALVAISGLAAVLPAHATNQPTQPLPANYYDEPPMSMISTDLQPMTDFRARPP